MIINIVLAVLFLASAFALWYRLSVKIPELLAIPDHVIVERLHEDSARAQLFILHIKSYYRERQYEVTLWKVAAKLFYRFHLLLLRVDNGMVRLLKRAKVNGGLVVPNSLESINEPEETPAPHIKNLEPEYPKSNRIVEVRKRDL